MSDLKQMQRQKKPLLFLETYIIYQIYFWQEKPQIDKSIQMRLRHVQYFLSADQVGLPGEGWLGPLKSKATDQYFPVVLAAGFIP